ncbi:MAG: hypothetical protein GXP61_03520 [Epsilonproteobacteria bacterium]|nr:hypothetical protein [Campylobacterota bacterium]
MNQVIIDIFESYKLVIIFFHILSASLLIGSMFVMIFIIRPINVKVKNIHYKCSNCLKLLKRFIYFIVPDMLILLSASMFMNVGMGFAYGDPTAFIMIHIKESLWIFIAFNFLYIYKKYLNAKKALEVENYLEVQENIILIMRYLMPLNLVCSLIAVYFGIIIKGY